MDLSPIFTQCAILIRKVTFQVMAFAKIRFVGKWVRNHIDHFNFQAASLFASQLLGFCFVLFFTFGVHRCQYFKTPLDLGFIGIILVSL